jgi:hypothetical protein
MMLVAGYIVFTALCWCLILHELKNAPTDVELWGEEIE